jgi:hypothetical protein
MSRALLHRGDGYRPEHIVLVVGRGGGRVRAMGASAPEEPTHGAVTGRARQPAMGGGGGGTRKKSMQDVRIRTDNLVHSIVNALPLRH